MSLYELVYGPDTNLETTHRKVEEDESDQIAGLFGADDEDEEELVEDADTEGYDEEPDQDEEDWRPYNRYYRGEYDDE